MTKPTTLKTIDCGDSIKVEIFDNAFKTPDTPFGVRMHDYDVGETVFPVYFFKTRERAEAQALKMATGKNAA
jgi:hypothetical protein